MPTPKTVWDECRALVADDEPDAALGIAESFLKGRLDGSQGGQARRLLDSLVLARANGRRLTKRVIDGTLSAADEQAERGRSVRSLLALITEIERLDKTHSPLVPIDLSAVSTAEKLMATESHLRSTGWLAEGLRLATGVCRLTDGRVFGSGFRCRADAILTNNHVIQDKVEALKFRAEFFFEENSRGVLRVPVVAALEPDRLFWTSAELDVSLVGLSALEREDIAVIPLMPTSMARMGDRVSIIQHPSGGPKQMAVTNNRIINIYDHRVQYLTDTLPGSSGSPVFMENWSALAIHHAGGNMKKDAGGKVIFANEGIAIAALFENVGFRAAFSAGV